MRRRVLAVVLACALIGVLSATTVLAYAADPIVKSGHCTLNGAWRLEVDQYDTDHIRVRFVVRSVAPGSLWQFFGTDDDLRIFSLKKNANDSGVARVIRIVSDQVGVDLVKAQAINYESGNICGGGLSF